MSHHQMNDARDDRNSPECGKSRSPVRWDDLVELVLQPLAGQIDRARVQILAHIKDVNDTAEIIARQLRDRLKE